MDFHYGVAETGLDHMTLQAPFSGTGSFWESEMLTVHHTVAKVSTVIMHQVLHFENVVC